MAGSRSGTDMEAGSKSARLLAHGGRGLRLKVCGRLGLCFWVHGRHGADRLLLCLANGEWGTAVKEHPLYIIHKRALRTISRQACLGPLIEASVKENTEGVVRIVGLTRQI